MNIKAQEYVLKVLKAYLPDREFTTKCICNHRYAITNQFGISILVSSDYGEFEEVMDVRPINGVDGHHSVYGMIGSLFMTSSELETDIHKQCDECFPREPK